jgi:hypothetical protein
MAEVYPQQDQKKRVHKAIKGKGRLASTSVSKRVHLGLSE